MAFGWGAILGPSEAFPLARNVEAAKARTWGKRSEPMRGFAVVWGCILGAALANCARGDSPLDGGVPSGTAIPERGDYFSTYEDAYMNPESVQPHGGHERFNGMDQSLVRDPRARNWVLYGGPEILYYTRNEPINRVLVNQFTPFGTTAALQSDQFDVGYEPGVRARIGVELVTESQIEFSYFFLHDFREGPITSNALGISIFGSATNNASATYAFDFQGGELVYRRRFFEFRQDFAEFRWVGAIRYLTMDESFTYRDTNIFYLNRIENDMMGPELGVDVKVPFYDYFAFKVGGRGGALILWQENRIAARLPQGQTFTQDNSRSVTDHTPVVEFNIGFEMNPFRNLRLHAGWEFIWLFNVGTATGEIRNDGFIRPSRPSNNDEVFWNGWSLGGELRF